ncbi:hypothetical protein QU487_18235 [Crenobacter sp. SG2305]|uniref:hypothetical protein n=1 Tax=Crenobacter oryzisoli TaxID=3056844 RepID=UPI0025AAF829|nr:hypothetical protein [Crenobacter sp. SG2305]MDN0084674.1 hypothetical protein [Crenobacter sp. SG2305]
MKSTAITMVILLASSSMMPAQGAGVIHNAEQASKQTTSNSELQRAITKATGYDSANLEVETTKNQITITIINSKLNTRSSTEREAEATKIISAISDTISENPNLAKVVIFHIDYVIRTEGKTRPIQRIDFHKTPAGVFVLHKT